MEGKKVGPYRLMSPLGSGGMGVVWDAWDERLERRVAVKHLRPERHDDPRARRRFLREARAVARLSHPAIVPVFDLVETDDGDWIVMERVEGPTLAERLRRGPLALAEVLAMARDVAAGLAEAHGKGLLHRDLKAGNVVLSADGRARILDFGLAKPYWGGAEDDGISEPGELVGSYRSMSPEQVRGLPLDPRSDLFSFGVLLYETVTGVPPFRAESSVETLKRICSYQPTPAAERNPAVPAALSELIDELLDKNREQRPRDAHTVMERLAAVAAQGSGHVELDAPTVTGAPRRQVEGRRAAWARRARSLALPILVTLAAVLLLGRRLVAPPSWVVAVAAVEVGRNADAEAALAAEAVRESLLRTLIGLDRLAPRAAERDTPAASPLELARALAADEVVVSRLDCRAETCRTSLERRAGASGEVLWIESVEGPLRDLPLLATAVAAALERGYPRRRRSGVAALTVERDDYERYLRLERAFRSRPEGMDLDALLAALAAIRDSSPDFLEAYLLEARLASFRHFDSRDPDDLGRAFARLREAGALAPDDPRVADARFSVALPAGRVEEAAAALAELERLSPGDVRILVRRALLADRRGEGRHALGLLRTAARRSPSWRTLLELANLEYRQGEIAAARATLTRVRERFPDDREGLALWAQVELLAGEPARAAELYGELVRRSPRFADLTNLGTAQLLLGRYPEAASTLRQAMALAPDNPTSVLNLADAELLRGRDAEAERLYRRVVALIDRDPATETYWQWWTVRAQAQAHLGDGAEAVASIQRGRQLAPDNPQAAYEAALVYAVVGDRASALVSARQALDGGVAPRWFRFPWFDALREHPALAARLGG